MAVYVVAWGSEGPDWMEAEFALRASRPETGMRFTHRVNETNREEMAAKARQAVLFGTPEESRDARIAWWMFCIFRGYDASPSPCN